MNSGRRSPNEAAVGEANRAEANKKRERTTRERQKDPDDDDDDDDEGWVRGSSHMAQANEVGEREEVLDTERV